MWREVKMKGGDGSKDEKKGRKVRKERKQGREAMMEERSVV